MGPTRPAPCEADVARLVRSTKHRGTAERERSTAPELH